jgi:uncharacterized protein (DUF58 family)
VTTPPLLDPGAVARLGRLRLRLRARVEGRFAGAHRARGQGSSQDFADYREYTRGDDPRLVDRHAYARLGRRLVKLYAAEDTAAVRVVLDASASMGFGAKWVAARAVALGLASVTAAGGDRVRLLLAGEAVDPGPWFGGPATVPAALVRLGRAEPAAGAGDLAAALRVARGDGPPGPVVLVSDLLVDGWEDVVRTLGSAGTDALLVHTLGREDLEPRVDGDVRVVDAETGAEVEFAASPGALQRHADRRDAWLADVTRTCGARGVAYARLVDDQPAEDVFHHDLRRAGWLS